MKTYGIQFPFNDSLVGDYLEMTQDPEKEIKASLLHLLLTKKGSRYYLPDFGTRLYDYLFNMNDKTSHSMIESEVRDSVRKYLPNVQINSIVVNSLEETDYNSDIQTGDERLYRTPGDNTIPYTAQVRIDYTITNGSFNSSDFIILNF